MRVAVIGGGVIGLTCAVELRKRGAEVVLLERATPGAGASSGNAGWLVPVFSSPLPAPGVVATSLRWMLQPDSPLFIRPRPNLALLRWLWTFWRKSNQRDFEHGLLALSAFSSHALADFDTLHADGVEMEMVERGVLFLFTDPASADHLRHEIGLMAPYGYAHPEILDHAAVERLEPATARGVVGGLYVPKERHLRPETLLRGLTERAVELGVDVRRATPVIALTRRGDRVSSVLIATGSIEADEVVVCAGAWSPRLLAPLGLSVPIEAGRGYGVTVTTPGVTLRHPTYLVERRIACTPLTGTLRLAGTMEFAGLDAAPEPRRFVSIRRGADQYLRSWRGTSDAEWCGPRPVTPDGLPMIGRFGAYRNLSIASGHAMLGVTQAPSTAIAIADLLCDGRSRYDVAAFAPGRFG
jgi:D-amino-acid dehydrogenase